MMEIVASQLAIEEIKAFAENLYGHQLNGYHSMYFTRRLSKFSSRHGIQHKQQLIDLLLNNPDAATAFKNEFHLSYTQLFREPLFFLKLIRIIEKCISKQGVVHIWHTGCAQGHEAYSLGILLAETGLLEKCKIYATDANRSALTTAGKGIVKTYEIKAGIKDYIIAGGKRNLSEHFQFNGENAILKERIFSKIKFAFHELGKHPGFQKFDVIICRNLLIYYKSDFQKELIKSMIESLNSNGYIGLSNCEAIDGITEEIKLKRSDIQHNIYQLQM